MPREVRAGGRQGELENRKGKAWPHNRRLCNADYDCLCEVMEDMTREGMTRDC